MCSKAACASPMKQATRASSARATPASFRRVSAAVSRSSRRSGNATRWWMRRWFDRTRHRANNGCLNGPAAAPVPVAAGSPVSTTGPGLRFDFALPWGHRDCPTVETTHDATSRNCSRRFHPLLDDEHGASAAASTAGAFSSSTTTTRCTPQPSSPCTRSASSAVP